MPELDRYGTNHAAQVGRNDNEGADMDHEDRGADQEQLEKHSLPGTNQAGKGPGSCEDHATEDGSADLQGGRQDQLEEHSLPGTNQAGKGAASCE
jgi:hypothetical protein